VADKEADFSGVTNPKRVIDRQMRKAEGVDAGEVGKKWDDTFDKPGTMSQAQFSGYNSDRKSGPPAAMLKKRASKE
jgi:hypothetical protein